MVLAIGACSLRSVDRWVISLVIALLLANPALAGRADRPVSFPTTKSVATIRECLTDKLSEVGEVADLTREEDSTILLVRNNPEGPMVIELRPSSVVVTTRFISGTRKIIKDCV